MTVSEDLFVTRAYSWMVKNKIIFPAPKCVCGKSLQPLCFEIEDSPANHLLKYGKLIYRSRVSVNEGTWKVNYWTGRYKGAAPTSGYYQDPLIPNLVGQFCGPRCPSISNLREVLWQNLRDDVWKQMKKLFPGTNYTACDVSRSHHWCSYDLQKFFISQFPASVVEVFLAQSIKNGSLYDIEKFAVTYCYKNDDQTVDEAIEAATTSVRSVQTFSDYYRPLGFVAKALLYIREEKFYPEGTFIDAGRT